MRVLTFIKTTTSVSLRKSRVFTRHDPHEPRSVVDGEPGIHLTMAAAARSAKAAATSKPSAAAKAVRGQTANAPRKNDRIPASRMALGYCSAL